MTRTLALLTAAAAACALLLSLAGGASAQTTTGAVVIDGFPLKIFSDPTGRTQVQADGSGIGEFYPQSSDSGHAGFDLILDPQGAQGGPITYGAFSGFLPTPDSGPTLVPGNPATITTVWTLNDPSGSPAIRLTQVLSYPSGSRQFDAHYTVQNIGQTAQSFRANVASDLAIRGSDSGIGFLVPGPPRFMGGLNQDVGAAGGFVEETPWSAFESNSLGLVSTAANDASGPGFDNSISQPPPVDNAAGVQWDNFYPPNSLAPGQSFTFNVGWRFIDTLGITPLVSNQQTGNEQDFTATVGDLTGSTKAGQKVVWTVVGSNSASGTSVSGANGQATFSYVGGNPGQDQITAFVDQNGNGVRDGSEPQATATVNWTGPPPPIAGVNVGVRPEAGTVKIKLPKHTSPIVAKRFGVTAAAGKFVKLTAGADIPVGSTVDTTKGRVRLLSAASPAGNTFQGGSFNGSQFLVGQGHGGGLTTLSMAGGNLNGCGNKTPKGGAARRRGRSLFSNVHGSFRTRGRNSSATVRGTIFLVKDTCKGTLTQVTRGVVIVRDFTLRKNKVVKAGHKYLARPPKKH